MTTTEEELKRDYQKHSEELEEQEKIINRCISDGEDYTQDIIFQARQLIDKRATSMEPFMGIKRELQKNEANYVDGLLREKKQITLQKEEAEQIYRKKRQELAK